jgi:TRAP-type C4-dicarboxylate transport system permease small subunit
MEDLVLLFIECNKIPKWLRLLIATIVFFVPAILLSIMFVSRLLANNLDNTSKIIIAILCIILVPLFVIIWNITCRQILNNKK